MGTDDQSMDLPPNLQKMIEGLREDAVNRYMDGDDGALERSVAMNPRNPAFWMLLDGKVSTTDVYSSSCYICADPEYAVMGLPLCRKCPRCTGHIPADDDRCDTCGGTDNPYSQTSADGHAPDGFESLDPAAADYPYGDFETTEPFRIQIGVNYDGSPTWFGDWKEPYVPRVGDYVAAGGEDGPEGRITDITEGLVTVRVEKMFGPPDPDPEIVCCKAADAKLLFREVTFGGQS